MKRQIVKGLRTEGKPLKVALEAIGIASSSYYYRPVGKRKPRVLDAALVADIKAVRRGHAEVYGYRKITQALRTEGRTINTKKVLRHLRALGLTQPRKVKGQRWSRPALVKPTRNNVYWEADFTYVWTGTSNAFLCVVIDACDRDIVGNVFSDRCRALEAAEALEEAILSRFGGRVPYGHQLTLRIDRGSQFTAQRFRETARALNVKLEYAGIQCPEDKPYVESFFSSYKTEELYRSEYDSLADARARWESYRDWYRRDRLHQSLGYVSPVKYATLVEKIILCVA